MIKGEVTKFTDNKTDYPFRAYVSPNYLSKDGESYNIADRLDAISEKISDYEDKVNDYYITEIYIKNVRLQKEDGTLEKLNNYDLYVSTDYDNKVWKVEYTSGEYYYGYGAKCIPNKLIADVKIKNAVDEFEELNAEMTCFGNEVAPDFIRDKHNWQLKFKSEYRFGDVSKTDEIRLFADDDDRNHIRAKFGSVAWEDLIKTDSNVDVLKDNNYDSLPDSFKKNKIQGCYKADVVKVYINQSETEYVENADYQGLYSLLNQKNEKMYGFNVADGAAIETYWPFTFSTNGSALDTALSGFTGTRAAMASKTVDCYMGYRYGNLDKYRPRGWDLRGPWIPMNDQPLGTYDTEGFRWQAGTQTDDKIQSFNDMIEVINNTSVSGMAWVNLLNEKLDIKSVIDYYLFNNVYLQTIANYRNMYLWNDDCSSGKWHIGGGNTHYFWDNGAFGTINREIHSDIWFYSNSENILFERLWNETTLISDRYKELRNNGVFTSEHAYEMMNETNFSQWYYQSTFDQNSATSGCMFDGSHIVSDPNGVSADIKLTNRTNQLGVSIDNAYNVSSTDYKNFNIRLTRLDTFFENGTMNHKYALLSKIDLKKEKFIIPYETSTINLYDYINIEPYYFNNVDNNLYNVSATCNDTAVTINTKVVDGDKYKITANISKATKSLLEFKISNNEFALFNADNPANKACNGQVRLFTPILIQRSEKPTVFTKTNIIYNELNYFDLDYETNVETANIFNAKIELNGVDVTSEFETDGVNRYVIPDKYTSDTSFDITVTVAMEGLDLSDTQTKVMKYDTAIGRPIMRIGTGWGVFVDTGVYSDDYNDGKITLVGHLEKMAAYYGAGFYNGNFWFFGTGISRNINEIGMDYRDTQNTTRVVFRANYTKEQLLSFTIGKANATHKLLLEYFVNKSGKVTDMITGVSSTATISAAGRGTFDNNVAPIYLYDCNRGGSSLQKKYGINYLYSFTVENSNGIIVRDLMPVFYNGNPCFYDTITKQHFAVNSSEADPSYQIKYTTYSNNTYMFLDKTGESILQ